MEFDAPAFIIDVLKKLNRVRRKIPSGGVSPVLYWVRMSLPSSDVKSPSRRKFLRRSAFTAVGSAVAAFAYGKWERHHTVTDYTTVQWPGEGLTAPCRVVQLTDLHIDPKFEEEYLAGVMDQVNALKPDVIALTGDFVTARASAMAEIARIMGGLRAPGGIFACLGNHDQWNGSFSAHRRTLEGHGIRVLNNESVTAKVAQGELAVSGVQSVWAGNPQEGAALKYVPKGMKALFLVHEPDLALTMDPDAPVGLQLSGHTHGGQDCIPGGHEILLPNFGKHFARGLYTNKAPWPVYVSRGIGTLGPHFRVAARPEITCLTLEP